MCFDLYYSNRKNKKKKEMMMMMNEPNKTNDIGAGGSIL